MREVIPKDFKNVLVTVMAENMDTKTPRTKVSANPSIKLEPNQKRIIPVMMLEILESRIESHARENPSFIEVEISLPCLNSSLVLSAIRILASTAIPIERINPAIPAAVSVIGISLNTKSIIIT